MVEIATISALAGLARVLVETLRAVDNLLSRRTPFLSRNAVKGESVKLKENVRLFYQRLGTLAEHLEKSELLKWCADGWLDVYEQKYFPHSLDQSSDDEATRGHKDLERFLQYTKKDHINLAMFQTDYKEFPTVQTDVAVFRHHLTTLENIVQNIPSNNYTVIRGQWLQIYNELESLKKAGLEVSQKISGVHRELIKELKEAAQQPPPQ